MSRKLSKKQQKQSALPKIDTLIQDIYTLFDKGADLSTEMLQAFASSLTTVLKDRFASYKEPRVDYLRFSNIGKNPRQLWLDINGTHDNQETLTASDKLKFLYGDIIELLVFFLAEAAGHKVTDRQREVELDGIKGSIDGQIDGELVDVKSTSGYSFGKFSDEVSLRANNAFGYVEQLSGYGQSLGKDHAYFLAVDKERGQLQLCKLGLDDVRPRIQDLKVILSEPEPPFQCSSERLLGNSGNKILGYPCTYCKHKDHCWKDANNGQGLLKYEYSDGIKYFTHVAKEPQVQKVD